ncbi:hypothetical protein TNCV_173561 [Trichonephila clavipes]|nr:hypothetical protein TNCV_173561 [Trichonephila clavipes]
MSSFLVLCEGNTRNRWRDGQVGPDVRQGTMAPWARRLGKRKKRSEEEDEKSRERTDGRGRERRREEREREKTRGVRDWSGKTMNAGGVENGI